MTTTETTDPTPEPFGIGPRTGTDARGHRWVEVHPNHWHVATGTAFEADLLDVVCTGAPDDGSVTTADLCADLGLTIDPTTTATARHLDDGEVRDLDRPVDVRVAITDREGGHFEALTSLTRDAADAHVAMGETLAAAVIGVVSGWADPADAKAMLRVIMADLAEVTR